MGGQAWGLHQLAADSCSRMPAIAMPKLRRSLQRLSLHTDADMLICLPACLPTCLPADLLTHPPTPCPPATCLSGHAPAACWTLPARTLQKQSSWPTASGWRQVVAAAADAAAAGTAAVSAPLASVYAAPQLQLFWTLVCNVW